MRGAGVIAAAVVVVAAGCSRPDDRVRTQKLDVAELTLRTLHAYAQAVCNQRVDAVADRSPDPDPPFDPTILEPVVCWSTVPLETIQPAIARCLIGKAGFIQRVCESDVPHQRIYPNARPAPNRSVCVDAWIHDQDWGYWCLERHPPPAPDEPDEPDEPHAPDAPDEQD